MGTIINFPGRTSGQAQTGSSFDQDVVCISEAIRAALPQAALDHIDEHQLTLAAASIVARLDEVRAIRHVAQDRAHAAARAACEAAVAGEGAPASPGRGEYEALSELFGGRPPSDDPPGPAVA